jgi:hypothetical protein
MLNVFIMNVTFYYFCADCSYGKCRYAECRYAESRYVECRGTLFDQLVFCWLNLNQLIFMNLLNLPQILN